jgi:hypothetical protein
MERRASSHVRPSTARQFFRGRDQNPGLLLFTPEVGAEPVLSEVEGCPTAQPSEARQFRTRFPRVSLHNGQERNRIPKADRQLPDLDQRIHAPGVCVAGSFCVEGLLTASGKKAERQKSDPQRPKPDSLQRLTARLKVEPFPKLIRTSAFRNILSKSRFRSFLRSRFLPLRSQSLKFRQLLEGLELGGFQRGGFMEATSQREL